MRILHVITTLERAGAENHLRDVIERQRRAGHELACGYLKGAGYWQGELAALGVAVTPLGLSRYGELAPLIRLKAAIEAFRPDVVHAHLQPAELYAALALRGKAPPLVISRHNCAPFYKGPFEKQLEGWVFSRAAGVIGISEAVGRRLSGRHPSVRPRLRVIPYGLDLSGLDAPTASQRAQTRRVMGVGDEIAVGTVCRLIDSKRVDVLIDAIARIPDRVRLIIVGDGPARPALEAQISHKGVADRVMLTGFRTDIINVMRAFDMFAFASEIEGFGLVLLEAMAAGLPVVACNISPMAEIVVEGETGLLAEVGNSEEFASCIHRLASDAALREKFATAGQRRVQDQFSIEKMMDGLEDVYRCVVPPKVTT